MKRIWVNSYQINTVLLFTMNLNLHKSLKSKEYKCISNRNHQFSIDFHLCIMTSVSQRGERKNIRIIYINYITDLSCVQRVNEIESKGHTKNQIKSLQFIHLLLFFSLVFTYRFIAMMMSVWMLIDWFFRLQDSRSA